MESVSTFSKDFLVTWWPSQIPDFIGGLSFLCSTYKTSGHPLLFESCVSDILVMNRVEAVRNTGPQILLELWTDSTEPQWCFDNLKSKQNGSLGSTCFVGNCPPHLHITSSEELPLAGSWSECAQAESRTYSLGQLVRTQTSTMCFSGHSLPDLDGSRLQGLVLPVLSLLAAGGCTPMLHFPLWFPCVSQKCEFLTV